MYMYSIGDIVVPLTVVYFWFIANNQPTGLCGFTKMVALKSPITGVYPAVYTECIVQNKREETKGESTGMRMKDMMMKIRGERKRKR